MFPEDAAIGVTRFNPVFTSSDNNGNQVQVIATFMTAAVAFTRLFKYRQPKNFTETQLRCTST